MRTPVIIWLLLAWLVVPLAYGREPVRVEVSAPYIELHTGPGRGYPIFYVAERGEDIERSVPFMKGYTVFNVEQIEGLPEHYYAKPEPKMTGPERIAHAEAFFANTGADIRFRGTRAYYAIEPNYIAMPPIESFIDAESFYATLAHETTHWTRHSSRLERDFGRRPGAMRAMPAKNSLPGWVPHSSALIWN